MKVSKEFSYAMIFFFLTSLILSYFDLLLINENIIIRIQLYFLLIWRPLTAFLMGYPLDVLVLISLTIAVFYILKILGIRIQ